MVLVVGIPALMPSKQKKLTLVAKPAKSNIKEDNPSSPASSLANVSMADVMQASLSGVDADSLVERITAEMLKGVDPSRSSSSHGYWRLPGKLQGMTCDARPLSPCSCTPPSLRYKTSQLPG